RPADHGRAGARAVRRSAGVASTRLPRRCQRAGGCAARHYAGFRDAGHGDPDLMARDNAGENGKQTMRPRPVKWMVCLFAAWMGALQPWAKPFTLYVAPNGNDAQPGTIAKPLATLDVALTQAREARRVKPAAVRDGVTIFLRAGTYELSRPVVVTPADSGASA